MKLQGNRALIKPLPQGLESVGALLILPPTQNQMFYTVLAVGPGRKLKDGSLLPPEIKPGDRILIHSFQHDQFTFEDGRKIVDASAVLAVVG